MEFCHLHGFSFLLQLIFPEMNIAVSLLQPVLCNLVGIIVVRLMMTMIVRLVYDEYDYDCQLGNADDGEDDYDR